MILAFDGLIFGLVFLMSFAVCSIILLWTGSLLIQKKEVGGGHLGCAGLALIPVVGILCSIWRESASGPIETRPEKREFVGVWGCSKLPVGFTNEAGERSGTDGPMLNLRADGSMEATNFPTDEPYRYENFSSSWSLVEPGRTPSGRWSLSVNGYFIKIHKDDSLRFPIDVTYNYEAVFRRMSEK